MTDAEVTEQAPLVSVLMPTFNGARLIAASIASLQAQEHDRLEIVVVDDGSTDDTAQVVAEIAARDRRVHLIRERHGGIAAARNLALAHASGEFVTFLDHDDLCPPGKLARQLATMARTPGAAALFGRTVMFTSAEPAPPPSAFGQRAPALTMCLSAALFRRWAFDRVGPLDPRFRIADDFDFILRLVESGLEITLEDEVATLHRLHAGQASGDVAAARREMVLALAASVGRRRRAGELAPLRHPLLAAAP